ncbi:hypothetical protein [Nonlabens antarcticus]|uniref:hypothetical protein n=1 Tax=Nonlabens antarcticus TaxID=392714 RepID=UPI001891A223|nr:hypothetical protein [Nonlabens antarcticus]
MRRIAAVIITALMFVSCNTDQIKKVFDGEKSIGMPKYFSSYEALESEIEHLTGSDNISLGFSSGMEGDKSYFIFIIYVENPRTDIDASNEFITLTSQMDPIIERHITNLEDYTFYKVIYFEKEKSSNIENKQSVIVTQEIVKVESAIRK